MRCALATEKRNKQPAVTKDHQDSEYPQEHALQDVGVYGDFIVVKFIFLAGCKRENVVTAISSTNTQLQADLDRIARLPLEHDPAERPLILSEPAANRRQWAIQTLKRAYPNRREGSQTGEKGHISTFNI